jgi:hypothetical protein
MGSIMHTHYTLLQKSKNFTLLHCCVKNKEYWAVSLTPTAKVWLSEKEIADIKEFFICNSLVNSLGPMSWKVELEESARAMYNWVNIKWSGYDEN